jgi:hypothetical protein
MLVIIHPVDLVNAGHCGNLCVDVPAFGNSKGRPIDKVMNILALFLGANSITHEAIIA